MRRIVTCLVALIMLFSPINVYAQGASSVQTNVPSKQINLVYDDSGSMISENGKGTDRWCQAKYSMEVITAMLEEKDTLNVYYMSSYSNGETDTTPQISLKGSTSSSEVEKNVSKIHNNVTHNGKTPFGAVQTAYNGLLSSSADEKWLVVLTDGKFNDATKDQVNDYYHQFTQNGNVKVITLFMGTDVDLIDSDEANGIYCAQAKDTSDILEELTKLCNQIYQNNALEVDEDKKKISFNVPMSQLVVFAQGKNVSIEGIKCGKTKYTADSNVKVEYSTEAAKDAEGDYGKDNWVINKDLNGYVATFNGNFEEGKYDLLVDGADDIQVYYKPNVQVAAYLYDGNKEVTSEENLVAGEYELEFGFVNANTGKKIKDTSLLGDIKYSSVITNTQYDNTENTIEAKDGDTVKIKEGQMVIDVTANYLDYNTVETKLTYEIYSSNKLSFSIVDSPDYELTTSELVNADKPIVVKAMVDNGDGKKELTEEQWNLLDNIEVSTKSNMGEFKVEKGDEVGTYKIYPTLKNNDPLQTDAGDIEVRIKGSFSQNMSVSKGETKKTITIKNSVSPVQKLLGFIQRHLIQLIVGGILFFLLLGYMPGIKKRFSRKLVRSPFIDCAPEKFGVTPTTAKGKFRKDTLSVLLPYVAETGSITFSPSPARKTAKVKAAGGTGIWITNTKMFSGKSEYNFGGMTIEENRTKPYRITVGTPISLKTDEFTYTCYLNRKN